MIKRARQPETWLIVGSSPSMPRWFDLLLGHADTTITTNAGILEFLGNPDRSLRPDYYLLFDSFAARQFGRYAATAMGLGTMLITKRFADPDAAPWPLEQAAYTLPLPDRGPEPQFVRGRYTHPRLSGLVCLQFAINFGRPDRIILCGFEGYRSNAHRIERDTFDGRPGKAAGEDHTLNWSRPFIRQAIEVCRDIQFVICGSTTRVPGEKWGAPNLTVYNRPDQFEHDSIGPQTPRNPVSIGA